jgi:hypothetical protein
LHISIASQHNEQSKGYTLRIVHFLVSSHRPPKQTSANKSSKPHS